MQFPVHVREEGQRKLREESVSQGGATRHSVGGWERRETGRMLCESGGRQQQSRRVHRASGAWATERATATMPSGDPPVRGATITKCMFFSPINSACVGGRDEKSER